MNRVGAVGLLLLATACTKSATPGTTAAAPTPASSTQPRLCLASDLKAEVGNVDGLTGATGILPLRLRNVSTTPCLVSGTANVSMLDASHSPLPQKSADLDGWFGHEAPVTLPPGSALAFVPVSVSGLTEAGEPCASPAPRVAFWSVTLTNVGKPLVADGRALELAPCEGRVRFGGVTPTSG